MNILEKIFQAGVVGAGGAGFPTHIKFNGAAEYLLVNGVECEPLLETDKFLIRHKSHEIIKTVEILAQQLQAKKIVVGIKKKNTREVKALEQAIEALNSRVVLHLTENFYPAGDEQILVYELTNRQIPPGGIPKDVGVVVCNVGTVVNVYEALNEKSVTDKFVTILGEVKNSTILYAPIGTSIGECVEMAGGATIEDYNIILGGPMMGRIIEKDQLNKEVVTKTTGAVILLPQNHSIFKNKQLSLTQMINRSRSACIQCSLCTDVCPRNLIGHPLRPHRIMRTLSTDRQQYEVLTEALLCCECGVCELYACPMGLSPRTINGEIKNLLRKEGVKYLSIPSQNKVHEMREYRKVPAERLIARLDLSQYSATIKEDYICVEAKSVKIPLKQHIGKTAASIVKAGDVVEKGQLIAKVREEDLGANIHASIQGVIKEVSDCIWIAAEEKVVTQ
ncbi:4Fe-4S dicluster domain-containing protein [Alkaliphilus peptidifermentans]|uniref:Na+-translocating ferredoxin:NAD+ oxidoreductase RNF, RnfC subunit n=1 Tax=Alkaliphilus peptidifermentans DSM 18978 TaxID=1120976 RepID=A0A1G5KUY3_9FIRM|nr:4Fe-4S dicluster domain-containing protein [Alkaliphilus peptidifermentans]SCZ04483.1 Na+-translocating ferredoxin:NAD+ oxidoreductase RNF, RnfC subunit [Alkaliphilus peptidifermentans DSM 18978]